MGWAWALAAVALGISAFLLLYARRRFRALEGRCASLSEANASLELFVSALAHDLKAPLRGIGSLAHWLIEDLGPRLSAEDRQSLDLMGLRVKRTQGLVDGLLAYSRAVEVEDGPPAPLEAVAGEAWKSLGAPASFQLEQVGVQGLTVPSVAFRQLLGPLLDNAWKHHDAGQGRVQVQALLKDGHLQLCVEDDGPGVPAADRERAFEPLRSLRPKDQVEGSGLGLAYVRRLAALRGGRAWLEAAQPRGCRACVDLPWP